MIYMNNEPNFISLDEVKHFITLNGEKLILAQRKHWIITLSPIISTIFTALVLIGALYAGVFIYFSSLILFIAASLLVITVAISRIVNIIIGWYCHLYIVTNRRLMEIYHIPFLSYNVNELLLDQVRVAEVDIAVGTMFNELIGKGDVIIQLDLYVRQHTFILSDVAEPRKTAMFLTQVFGNRKQINIGNTLYRYQPKFIL